MSDPWDKRPEPGRTNDDPMCINCDCRASFSCRRFIAEPYQGEEGPTIFINPVPELLGGLLCASFDPATPHPSHGTPTHD